MKKAKLKSIHPPQEPSAESKLEAIGLLTPAASHAQEVEVMPGGDDANLDGQPMDLMELGEQVRPIIAKLRRNAQEMIYDIVSVGLFFLKVREIHEQRSNHQFGARADDHEGQGFRYWLTCHAPDLSLRTAQNYCNAAINAGLSPGSPITAVAELRKQKALHNAKPTQLYRSPQGQLPDGTPLPERPKPDLTRDVINDLITHCRHARDLRDTMNDDQLALVCRHLQHTLEYMVQAEYDIIGVKAVSRDFQG